MTILDRLVTRTDLNPMSKRALKGVRRAVMQGRCGEPDEQSGEWSIAIDTERGVPIRMSFSFRRG
jgi:hypothetical protein